jgi:phosphoserine phosphatase RsbU/P
MISNQLPQETINNRLFGEIVETLGYLAMERLSDATFRILGRTPSWFNRVFSHDVNTQVAVAPEDLSPFIENFLPIAEQFWLERSSAILKSGPWTETDPSGEEHHLELSVVNLGPAKILLLQILGLDYQEKQDLLQLCRDNSLDYEILFKTQQALKKAHELVLAKQRELDEDLTAAAEVQRRFLPRDLSYKKCIQIASKFDPCMLIAGDMFNAVPLDEDHVAIYILDVSGHGAPAAMLAVSVCQMLQPHTGFLMNREGGNSAHTVILSPTQVLEALDREFPMERFDKFFTIFFGIFNCHQGLLTYSNAGHPRPILLSSDGTMDFLDKGGTIIGLGGVIPFEQEERCLQKGDKIILYSDGVTELADVRGELFGMERLCQLVRAARHQPIASILDTIHQSLMEFVDPLEPQDDLSLFGIEIIHPRSKNNRTH